MPHLCSLAALGLLLLAALAHADTVTTSDLAGRTFVSRACENDRGATFSTRNLTFTEDSYWLHVAYHANNTCFHGSNDTIADYYSSGTYLLSPLEGQVPYTEVTAIDFFATVETLTPRTSELAEAYSVACGNVSFSSGTTRDVLGVTCPALGLESQSQCAAGEHDIIAFYQGALFLGDGGGSCTGALPTLLSTRPLLEEGQRDILAVEPTLRYRSVVKVAALTLSSANIMRTIEAQSAYFTRYFSTVEGLDSARDILEAFTAAADCSNDNVEVQEVQNVLGDAKYRQPSVIARLRGKAEGPEGEALVIVSAHLDSANFFSDDGQSTFADDGSEDPRWFTRAAPGADDNGSGVAVLLEVFRVLASIGYEPDRTIEFHLYAGEERGLVDGVLVGKSGSELIVRQLRQDGKQVVAAMNFDSIGSPFATATSNDCNPLGAQDFRLVVFGDPADNSTQAASIDPVSRDLFYASVNTFTDSPWGAQYGPNGASDHQSFIDAGYPAGGGVESNIAAVGLNLCGFDVQRHHTARDTIDGVDEGYVRQWALSVLGYLIEISTVPDGNPRFTSPDCAPPLPPPSTPPVPPSPFVLPPNIRIASSVSSPSSPSTIFTADLDASSSSASAIAAPLAAAALCAIAALF